MNVDSHPKKASNVVGRIINTGEQDHFEAVLVMPKVGQVKVLNEVGARIWDLTDGYRSVYDIAQLLSEEYDVPIEEALRDTLEFLVELHKKGIVII